MKQQIMSDHPDIGLLASLTLVAARLIERTCGPLFRITADARLHVLHGAQRIAHRIEIAAHG